MTSRLDYCNALLGGWSASSINNLQLFQNAAARVLTRSKKIWSYNTNLSSLLWSTIKFCINNKVLLLTYKALNGPAVYLTDLLLPYNPSCSLRSDNSGLLLGYRSSLKEGERFHIWLLNFGLAFLIMFGAQTYSSSYICVDHFARCKQHWSRSTSCFSL